MQHKYICEREINRKNVYLYMDSGNVGHKLFLQTQQDTDRFFVIQAVSDLRCNCGYLLILFFPKGVASLHQRFFPVTMTKL